MLGKSLVFHEMVMFLVPLDRFTSNPKNRVHPQRHPTLKVGVGKKSGVLIVNNEWKSGKTRVPGERENAEFSTGSFSEQRTSCVQSFAFHLMGANRSSSRLSKDLNDLAP